jgi:hypothetical protein
MTQITTRKNELTIDKEFAEYMRPMTPEEKSGLKKLLEENGCLDPILTWANHDDTVVDGHSRYELCKELDISFKVKALTFEDRDEVIEFIEQWQHGRRNLTPDQTRYRRGKKYQAEKNKHGDRGPQKKSGHCDQSFSTAEKLGAKEGVSSKTIRRDAKFAEKVDALSTEERMAIVSGRAKAKPKLKPKSKPKPKAKELSSSRKAIQFFESIRVRPWGVAGQFGSVEELFKSDLWKGKENQSSIGEYCDQVNRITKIYSKIDKECKAYCQKIAATNTATVKSAVHKQTAKKKTKLAAKPCSICGEIFTPLRKDCKYCGPDCRAKAKAKSKAKAKKEVSESGR